MKQAGSVATSPGPGLPAGVDQETVGRPPRRSAWGYGLLAVVLIGLSFYGLEYLAAALAHESTDDAFIETGVVPVAPRVAGQVVSVRVHENQEVKQGELLAGIDPRDYEARVAQKQAGLHTAQANEASVKAAFALVRAKVETAQAAARQAQADAEAARATADHAQADFQRNDQLRRRNTISAQEYDNARAAWIEADAKRQAAAQKAASEQSKIVEAQAQVDTARTLLAMAQAQVTQAEADARLADLDLNYTELRAPVTGRVTRKAIEVGAYLQVGQTVLALVPKDLWVVANFKETQLDRMRPGQPVRLKIEAYPQRTYRGHVDSVQAGSGARFSLLPPENAVGNYVKVVQRVPVKILFDEPLAPDEVVGPGMSVAPEVEVSEWRAPVAVLGAAAVTVGGLATLALGALTARVRRRPA